MASTNSKLAAQANQPPGVSGSPACEIARWTARERGCASAVAACGGCATRHRPCWGHTLPYPALPCSLGACVHGGVCGKRWAGSRDEEVSGRGSRWFEILVSPCAASRGTFVSGCLLRLLFLHLHAGCLVYRSTPSATVLYLFLALQYLAALTLLRSDRLIVTALSNDYRVVFPFLSGAYRRLPVLALQDLCRLQRAQSAHSTVLTALTGPPILVPAAMQHR